MSNEKLIAAGAALANIAYNLAQRAGTMLTVHECEVLDLARKAWDEAPRDLVAAAGNSQSPTEAQISAAGRALSDRHAKECGVDKDDNWKIYGQNFIDDARAAIAAMGKQEGGEGA